MSIDLSTYRAIQVANFVKLTIPGYATLAFSDFDQPVSIDGVNYTNVGQLLNISEFYGELRAVEQEVTVSLSGIPAGSIAEFLNNDPKGSTLEIRAGYFDPTTENLLAIANNPGLKFRGIVMSYGMTEDWDTESRVSNFTISLVCNSAISLLLDKVVGRRTNDADQQEWYPGDLSMSRVNTITRAQFQFGKAAGATT